MASDLMTPRELAEHLRVSVYTINEWARDEKIPEVRLSSSLRRFILADVMLALKRAQEGEK